MQMIVTLQLVANRLTQRNRAGSGGIAGHALVQRLFRGVADVCGGRKVGFARAEADDVHARGLHFLRPRVNCQRRGGSDILTTVRNRKRHKDYLLQ